MTKHTSGKCISCGINLVEKGYVRFSCPQCNGEVGRCTKCRHLSNEYICKSCGFIGP
ncbi:MAG: DUF1610 domain-containing protein [Planctomycetes bacterium]|nr:DUF1610 domain-containing protein [Planctomycetota bacterium]MCK5643558.1 DUF1610 domain-containing protein [Gammaproteobacteria bacterium]